MTKLTPLLKNCLSPKYKSNNGKFKIKSEFLFNLVSTETMERIIDDLDVKKASSGDFDLPF